MIGTKIKVSLVAWVRMISLVSLALLVGGLTLTSYLSQRWLFREFEQDREKPVRDGRLIIWKMEVHFERLEQELLRLARLEDLKEAFLRMDRGELLEQARPPLNRLRKSPLRVERISFYLPSGTVFLRAHNPDSYGDNVSVHRSLIVQATTDRRVIRGVEPEGNTFFLWSATPLYVKGQLIGIMEIGTPVAVFLQEVKSQLGAEVGLFVNNLLSDSKLAPAEATDRGLIGSVAPLLHFSRGLTTPIRQVIVVTGRTYAATLIPVRDLSPDHGVIFAVLFDVTPFTQLLGRNTRSLIGIGAGGFLLAALLIFFLTQRLEKTRRSLEARTAQLAAAKERELREAEVLRERKRAEEETRRNLERIRALREIDKAITSTLNLRTVLDVLLEKIDLVLPNSAVTVRLFNRESGLLEPVACRNLDEEEWRAEQWRGGRGIPNVVFESKAPMRISDVQTDPRVKDPEFFRKHGLVSYLGVPLTVEDEILGVLSFYTRGEHKLGSEEIEFLSTLAGQAALAIHNSQLYEEMAKLARKLERSNNVKEEFLSVMSHELRTPLTAVIGYAGMLQEGFLGEINQEQAKGLGVLLDQTNDLLTLINSILDVTKMEAGTMVLEKEEVNLKSFLDVLRLTYDTPRDKSLTLVWDYAGHLPRVTTDAGKLKRILQNLVNNAIKFTDAGNVTISARVVGGPEGNGHESSILMPSCVEFKVADTGIGIPKEALPVIFEKFRQVDNSETRPYGGVGLGLHIVKEFTEMLGGKIEVDSEPGRGSVFTVTLPCEKAPPEVSSRRVPAADGHPWGSV